MQNNKADEIAMADPTLVCGFEESQNCKIQKSLIQAGRGGEPNYTEGTKVCF